MGRMRKPLSEQTGNLTQDIIKQREYEQSLAALPADRLKTPPDWLVNRTAKKEWRRVVKLLCENGMISNADIYNVGGFFNAFAMYAEAS